MNLVFIFTNSHDNNNKETYIYMKDIIEVLSGTKTSKTPIWLMRQAGRYLPEYKKVRSQTNNFLEFCYNSELASLVTLQPLKRFDLSAAIIFSDILVIPDALGNNVSFTEGVGPRVEYLANAFEQFNERKFLDFLNPVYKAIEITKKDLGNTPLIGFSGAVWTLFSYLIQGRGSKDYIDAKAFALERKDETKQIVNIFTKAIICHLKAQIRAGCDIVKIFDSWAGILPEELLEEMVIEPTSIIVSEIKREFPHVKIICFPKGLNSYHDTFLDKVKTDCLAVDYSFSLKNVKNIHEKYNIAIQGNLDPAYLLINDLKLLEDQIKRILNEFKEIPHIFNLGHGVTPNSKIDNVEFLVNYCRK